MEVWLNINRQKISDLMQPWISNAKFQIAINHSKERPGGAVILIHIKMEAKEILQDIIVRRPESAYTKCALKYLNDRTKAAYLVAEMYDDLIDYPEESRQLFGSQTCFKIIEFCRQN